ncbi:hypothetical protein N2152v2_009542 [Parachlorella kessleri]
MAAGSASEAAGEVAKQVAEYDPVHHTSQGAPAATPGQGAPEQKEGTGGGDVDEQPAEVDKAVQQYDPVHHTGATPAPGESQAKGSTSAGGAGTATERAAQAGTGQRQAAGQGQHGSSPLDPGVDEDAKESETKSQVPGKPVELSTKVLDTGRDLLQRFAPLKSVHEHVCGFHFYAHDMTRQVEAHHYCAHLSEEFRQCIIYDSDQPGARLLGIEYIISERLFKELPEEEKKLWHSHKYEISSGILIAPRVPGIAERQDMQKLAFTYGKAFHFWQIDRGDTVPLGPPQLMMSYTADGQMDERQLAERDARYGVSSKDKRREREVLNYPEKLDPAVDHWQNLGGQAWQTDMVKQPFKTWPGGMAPRRAEE